MKTPKTNNTPNGRGEIKATSPHMKSTLIAVLLALLCSTSSASMFSKFIQKPVKWVQKQSGVKPTNDNVNKTLGGVSDAAKVITNMEPQATLAVESITRTSDVARDVLISIKWPLVLGAYCGALWLASLAFNGLSERRRHLAPTPGTGTFVPAQPDEAAESRGLRFSGRFVLIAMGSLLFFAGVFAIQLSFDSKLSLDANLMPYLAVAGFRSVVAATLLCWIPIQRAWIGLALGMAASLAMFAAIALGPEEPEEQQKTTMHESAHIAQYV
jgi:hypothetical protein